MKFFTILTMFIVILRIFYILYVEISCHLIVPLINITGVAWWPVKLIDNKANLIRLDLSLAILWMNNNTIFIITTVASLMKIKQEMNLNCPPIPPAMQSFWSFINYPCITMIGHTFSSIKEVCRLFCLSITCLCARLVTKITRLESKVFSLERFCP